VIARQIRYGHQRHVPWGISESCYSATDAHHVYQYRAFGVPGLGLKRGLADDLVVAPYATLLALPFAPVEACENLERLITHEEALGRYGMVEAIDYTPARLQRGKPRAVVRAYMSHHQGMGFLALSHLLLGAPMVRRFMSDPAVRATQLLLQERIPDVSPVVQPHGGEAAAGALSPVVESGAPMRVFAEPHTSAPEVHLLSNGNYHLMLTHTGGGYSRWRDLALTRWREDATCDDWGSFVYLRDVEERVFWSAAFQPTRRTGDQYEAIFTQGRVEYRRRDFDVETYTEICISPEDDAEIRRITLTNRSRRKRLMEITSYAEVVLAPLASDLAHRVFSNLFVRTEIVRDRQAILCTRRKRAESDAEVWMFHMMVVSGQSGRPSYETDRARFLGRGRTLARPAALDAPPGESLPLSNSDGPVLDPVAAIRVPVEVSVEHAVAAHLITGVAPTREAALALVDKYRDHHFVERAFEMAWSHSQIVLRQLNVGESETQLFGRLAGSLLFAHARHRAAPNVISRNQLGPRGLWRFGISGDLPIVLLRIGDIRRMELVAEVLRAHAYWRVNGLATDLVIMNEDFSGYRATLNDSIVAAVNAGADVGLLDKPGGVFVRRIENLSDEDQVLFQAVARVVLTDSAETLREQVERRYVSRRLPPLLEPSLGPSRGKVEPLPPRERILCNGTGGFTPDGREYVISLEPGATTPAPWVNVIASPHIGTVVSEVGSMYTWAENAHEFRLTSWHNDPVADPSGEALYLRDEETGEFWSLSPRPAPGRTGYVCRHGFGYSVFDHDEAGVVSEAWVYVAMDAPVKFMVVRLRNHSGRARRVSLAAFFELVLGEWRHTNLMHIRTEVDPQTGALFARNPYSRDFQSRVVFASCSGDDVSVTGSRAEFVGRNGTFERPDALRRTRLSGRTGAALDPGAGLQAVFDLADGQECEVVFTLGAASGVGEAQQLLQRFAGPAGARAALEEVWTHWNRLLGAVHVEAPEEPPFSVLVNGWLLYQTLSCRIWGRSGFYQSGGAYGFRDQLQDAMALLHAAPEILRAQILLCASRQFREGDVQHWWHPPAGAGVRTHFSDDLLWLPQAVARYVLATGDTGVLDQSVTFLEGRLLTADEESVYDQHLQSAESAPLYEHCVRAIRHSLRFGAHGLPLIGCGDWNDGMNRVGKDGRGESVWLAWFLCDSLRRFGEVAVLRQDSVFAELCRHEEEALRARTENASWDGDWYRRAYFDDGTPLGSAENDECRIDSLSQSWAVLSGAAIPDRARQAMQAVREQLVRPDDRLVLLFTPPFDKTPRDPGYIKGYPPGVRENGGQYTHGAIWTAMAFAQLGEHAFAWDLLRMLNPILHGDSPEGTERYRVEPYVMAADLYSTPPHTGRGGWTWYTGAAGWMYRFAVETLLGLERRPDHLRITPRLPPGSWNDFRMHYRFRERFYHINVRKAKAGEACRVSVDGLEQSDGRIPLLDDGHDHEVVVDCAG
jgi:cellobiose phosphorylase